MTSPDRPPLHDLLGVGSMTWLACHSALSDRDPASADLGAAAPQSLADLLSQAAESDAVFLPAAQAARTYVQVLSDLRALHGLISTHLTDTRLPDVTLTLWREADSGPLRLRVAREAALLTSAPDAVAAHKTLERLGGHLRDLTRRLTPIDPTSTPPALPGEPHEDDWTLIPAHLEPWDALLRSRGVNATVRAAQAVPTGPDALRELRASCARITSSAAATWTRRSTAPSATPTSPRRNSRSSTPDRPAGQN